jgi:hypothetical protein
MTTKLSDLIEHYYRDEPVGQCFNKWVYPEYSQCCPGTAAMARIRRIPAKDLFDVLKEETEGFGIIDWYDLLEKSLSGVQVTPFSGLSSPGRPGFQVDSIGSLLEYIVYLNDSAGMFWYDMVKHLREKGN